MRHAAVLLAGFAAALGYGTLVPLVPAYLRATGDSGGSVIAWHSGALAAAFLAAAALAAPLWGLLSDRAGRAPVLVAGLAGTAFSAAPFFAVQGLIQLYAFQALAGAFFGAVVPAALGLLFEEGDERRQAARAAQFGTAVLTGYLAGPALGGWLAGLAEASFDPVPANRVVLIAPIVQSLAAAVAIALLALQPRHSPAAPRERAPAADTAGSFGAFISLGTAMLASLALGGFEIGAAIHLRGQLGLSARMVSALFIACAAAMAIAQLALLPRLARRADAVRPALGLLAGAAVLISSIPIAETFSWVIALAGASGASLGLAIGLSGLGTAAGAGTRRGLALGGYVSALSAGQAVGSMAASTLFVSVGHVALPALGAAIAAGALAFGLLGPGARARHARLARPAHRGGTTR